MKIKYKNFRKKGETIIEVLIAVVVSTLVLASTFLMLNRAISTNVNVRNRVVALNIAREGIESVRNIRDTNWLKYSGDRRTKWLCWDTVSDKNVCASGGTNSSLSTGNYTIDYDSGD
jgi:type II secretory pathway pseudopilin PulG